MIIRSKISKICIVLSLVIMLTIAAAIPAMATTITLDEGSSTVSIPLQIQESKLFAGLQFTIRYEDTEDLKFERFRKATEVRDSMDVPHTEKSEDGITSHTFGFFTDEDKFTGTIPVGTLTLSYTGDEPITFTLETVFAYFYIYTDAEKKSSFYRMDTLDITLSRPSSDAEVVDVIVNPGPSIVHNPETGERTTIENTGSGPGTGGSGEPGNQAGFDEDGNLVVGYVDLEEEDPALGNVTPEPTPAPTPEPAPPEEPVISNPLPITEGTDTGNAADDPESMPAWVLITVIAVLVLGAGGVVTFVLMKKRQQTAKH